MKPGYPSMMLHARPWTGRPQTGDGDGQDARAGTDVERALDLHAGGVHRVEFLQQETRRCVRSGAEGMARVPDALIDPCDIIDVERCLRWKGRIQNAQCLGDVPVKVLDIDVLV